MVKNGLLWPLTYRARFDGVRDRDRSPHGPRLGTRLGAQHESPAPGRGVAPHKSRIRRNWLAESTPTDTPSTQFGDPKGVRTPATGLRNRR